MRASIVFVRRFIHAMHLLPLALLPMMAHATATFEYTISGSTATVTNYSGTDIVVTIPSNYNSYVVNNIGAGAFKDKSTLLSVTLPSSIVNIGNEAFRGCSSLANISILGNVTNIGQHAFNQCSSLTGISLPSSVTSIGISAFAFCYSLTSLTIPNSVATIANNTFQGCNGLTSITLSTNITSIGSSAFAGCGGLTGITLPTRLTSISSNAFADCTGLLNISIPSGVNSLGSGAFASCSNLTSIVFRGNMPGTGTDTSVFSGVNAIVYYTAGSTGWGATFDGLPTEGQVALTVAAQPPEGGRVTGGGNYWAGTNIQITATAEIGWEFIGWNDGDTRTTRSVTVPVEGATYLACFSLKQASDAALKFTTLVGLPETAGSANGTGTVARFNFPQCVAVGNGGVIYVADNQNHVIRKITSGGVVTTFAGTAGAIGSANGTGSAARFNTPYGVATDPAGNVYVADTRNHTIRKITAAGVVTTFAGSAGSAGSADGTNSSARFNNPQSVAVDNSGNVYVADTRNQLIRRITPAGVVSTLAGTTGVTGSADGNGANAQFNYPQGIAVDGLNRIYVADTFNNTIRMVTLGGDVITLAGLAGDSGFNDGSLMDARFNWPFSLSADNAGRVYVCDSANHTLRLIDINLNTVKTLGGLAGTPGTADGPGPDARFNYPSGIAANSAGNIFVADTFNHTIRQGTITQTTDVEVTSFTITWPSTDLLGQTPLDITYTFRNNGPWDVASNRFTAGVSIFGYTNGISLGTFQIPLAMRVGDTFTYHVPSNDLAKLSLPTNFWEGTHQVYSQINSQNSQIVLPNQARLIYADPLNFAGFIPVGLPTMNGVETNLFIVTGGTNITGSFTARIQNGHDLGQRMTAIVGFVDKQNRWTGDDPQVVYHDLPPASSGELLCSFTNLAPPAASGIYTLRYKAYLTWQIPACMDQFKSNALTLNDTNISYYMEGNLGAVNVEVPTDLQALGMNLTLPGGDLRGAHPAGMSVFLRNNGPGSWDWYNVLVEAYLVAQGVPPASGIRIGGADIAPLLAIGVTTTNAVTNSTLLQFTLPLNIAGGSYTVWLHATPESSAPQDTASTNNWAAGNTILIPNYTPRGQFNFTTWLGRLWSLGNTDGTGTAARFNDPSSIAADNSGNYYIADTLNHTIRKVTAAGVVTTFAGSPGSKGSADGSGSAARFNTPMGVAVDGSGNVYVADCYNNTIRKITAAGLVSTLAGTAGKAGSTDGTGAAARFAGPYAVAVDSTGTVYVADTWNHTIRKITAAGVVTTLAGVAQSTGSSDGTGTAALFYTPQGICVSPNGLIYVTDTGNHTIRKITTAGAVTTLAGVAGAAGSTDATGSNARFNTPTGITSDNAGFLYVTDARNQTIRGVNIYGVTMTIGGKAGVKGETDGLGTAARFNGPLGVAVGPSGNLVVVDAYNNIIRYGTLITVATVYTASSPASGGTVTGGGVLDIGTNVTLAATPNTGWIFSSWSDGILSNSRSITVPSYDSWYTARFLPTIGVAADAPTLSWSTGGASEWFGQLTTSHDNVAAMQSGAIGVGQTNWTQAVISNAPGSIMFWWRLSSAAGDTLQFFVNTQLVSQISGNTDWNLCANFLGSTNVYTLKWVYIRNNPVSSGSSAGWVDQVTWSPCTYATNVPQVFFQNTSGLLASWVLNNAGIFQFTRFIGNTGAWALKTAGDIDGDGVSDLLFQSPSGDTGGWFLNADGSTRDARFWWNIGAWEIKACADFEGLGRSQVFFQNPAGTVAYWRLDTNGSFLESIPVGNLGAWKLKAAGDLDGDGKAELFWQNAAGTVAIWFHNPDGTLRGTIAFNTGEWTLRAATDVDADGCGDLLWQTADGRTAGWFMTSGGYYRDARFWWNTGTWKLKAAGR